MEIQKFSPAKAEIQSAIEEVQSLTIKDVNDVAGYEAVKEGKKKLARYRIDITKFGKKQREEAIAWQKEVLRQERELLGMIEPIETKLSSELDAIDEQKKREERKVLLPARKKMLEEIGISNVENYILLDMDEKEFSEHYNERKIAFLEQQENKRKEEEEAKKRAKELEKAKAEAAEKAKKEAEEKAEREKKEEAERVEREKQEAEKKKQEELRKKEEEKIEAIKKAEREKQEEIDQIKREQKEKERKEKEEKEREERIQKETERKIQEELEQKRKNKKYKEFLEKNGYTEENKDGFYIHQEGNTFTLYKKIDQIKI